VGSKCLAALASAGCGQITRKSEDPRLQLGFRRTGRAVYAGIGNVRLQRLYSNFARGGPGGGLLVLRLGAGIPLLYVSIGNLMGADLAQPARIALDAVGAIGGILLLIGLWTPLAGAAVALTQLVLLFSQPFSKQIYPFVHFFVPVLGVALAMLGPGAWSIDARLFGRKRLTPPS
jgi:putative oxidoreductase